MMAKLVRKMKFMAMTALSATAVAGCSSEVPQTSYDDSAKQLAWIETSKDAVRDRLRDPESAQFRNVQFFAGSGVPIACGEVNAKNAFGSYRGFERFIAAGDVEGTTFLESDMLSENEMSAAWNRLCITSPSIEKAPNNSGLSATGDETLRLSNTAETVSLSGLGDLRLGQPVSENTSFNDAWDNYGDGSCVILKSKRYEGVSAITSGGVVRRITVYGEENPIGLAEGIRIGSTKAELLQAFPALIETPHIYTAGSYLTEPGNGPRRMFETDNDGKVTDIHVGLRPELEFVEGCL